MNNLSAWATSCPFYFFTSCLIFSFVPHKQNKRPKAGEIIAFVDVMFNHIKSTVVCPCKTPDGNNKQQSYFNCQMFDDNKWCGIGIRGKDTKVSIKNNKCSGNGSWGIISWAQGCVEASETNILKNNGFNEVKTE